jgi:hypothetical protein
MSTGEPFNINEITEGQFLAASCRVESHPWDFSPICERAYRDGFRDGASELAKLFKSAEGMFFLSLHADKVHNERWEYGMRPDSTPERRAYHRGRSQAWGHVENYQCSTRIELEPWWSAVDQWARGDCESDEPPPRVLALTIGEPVVMREKGGSERDSMVALRLAPDYVLTIRLLDRDGKSERRTAIATLYGPELVDGDEFQRDVITPDVARERENFVGGVHQAIVAIGVRDGFNPCDRKVISDAIIRASSTGETITDDKPRFARYTCGDLMKADFTVNYLVDGLLVEGQPGIVAAPQKAMKTSVCVDLALSLATGGTHLNRFATHGQRRVALFSGESGLATIAETLRRVADSKFIAIESVENLVLSPDLPRFDDRLALTQWSKFLLADGIQVAIVDPVYLCMAGGDAGNLFMQGEHLRRVSDVARECGVTLLLVHHLKKVGQVDPWRVPELADIAWSGFAEFARQWLLMNRRGPYTPGSGSHELWLSVGGSAGHGGLWALDIDEGTGHGTRYWQPSLRLPQEVLDDHRQTEQQQRQNKLAEKLETDKSTIVAAIGKLPDRTGTTTDIRTYAGINAQRFAIALAELVSEGHLSKVTITKGNKREYEAFKLADSPDE